MIDILISFFKKPVSEAKETIPEGLCPNCWGSQEYDKQIRDLYADKQIDVNNHGANHSFIQEFVISKVSGIKLVKGDDGIQCPTCRIVYPEK